MLLLPAPLAAGAPAGPAAAGDDTPPAQVRLAGRVVDRDGGPVAGAEIVARPHFDLESPASFDDPVEARSGPAGEFSLAPLRPELVYVLSIAHPGFAALEVSAAAPARGAASEPLELVLPPAITLRGRVLDPDEVPVPGAQVVLHDAGPSLAVLVEPRRVDEPYELSAITAADGSFAIPGLGAGRYDLHAEAPGFTPLRMERVAVPDQPEVEIGALYLAPEAALSGRVVDPHGRPLRGIAVEVHQRDAVAGLWRYDEEPKPPPVTGPDGRFTIGGLAAGVAAVLTADGKGYARRVVPGVAVPSDEPLEVELLPASRLSGQVVGADGDGVPHAKVLAAWREAAADADGRFVLDELSPGEVTVSVRAPGFLSQEMPPLRLAPGEERRDLRVVLDRAAAIAGRVTDPDGKPVARAKVSLLDGPTTSTDRAGLYRLEEVVPGAATVEAWIDGLLRARRELAVAAGGEHRLDLVLDPVEVGEVTGRVLDPAGRPVAGAEIWLRRTADGLGGGGGRSVADGRFRIAPVEPGQYQATASKAGYVSAESDVLDVVPGRPAPAGEMRLSTGAAVAGRVLGVDEANLGRVTLSMHLPDGTSRIDAPQAGVAPDGTYRLEGVPPGRWLVVARLDHFHAPAVAPVEVLSGQREVPLDLELGTGHTLTGRITLDGEPLPWANVTVSSGTPLFAAHSVVDPAGRFVVRNLPAGTYGLWVTGADGWRESREVELAGDREIELELVSGSVEGRVVDAATGAPLAGVGIAVARIGSLSFSSKRRTDADGVVRFDKLPVGRYEVRTEPGSHGAARAEVTVEPGARAHVDLRLEAEEELAPGPGEDGFE